MFQWPSFTAVPTVGRYQLYETETGALYRIDTVEATTWHWTGKVWRVMDEEPPDEAEEPSAIEGT